VPFNYLKNWCSGMEENKASIKIPTAFPLTPEMVKHVPTFGKGRNVLGVIYTILREKINRGQLEALSMEPDGQQAVNDVTLQMNNNLDLASGPSNIQAKSEQHKETNGSMEVDFAADDAGATMDDHLLDSVGESVGATSSAISSAPLSSSQTAALTVQSASTS